ncbi:PfkB family carbohydrate kinase [Frigidibacter sp. ROC022]|uniref:PfkB family carbohydrate kinase n=1 Tax=Frigidibacter sp. ROC022 TaxID=2971796 RepID=UPI00215AE794|nr:PfkB family carbohydrate kinase [Frigidibacter sp. ROC022]MCR8723928.1 PfkB family carbohydrate kinase [Frigidibacter sp. ROC022]
MSPVPTSAAAAEPLADAPAPDVLCIGSVLWDVIGRSPSHLKLGSDVPGRIARVPGGVAMNIAMTLRRFGLRPALLSSLGRDAEGNELEAEAARLGLDTRYLYRSDDLPTDVYMAIEGGNGLVAAIADAHSLEAAGPKILAPLHDGRLGDAAAPYPGTIALDGNLTASLLADIAADPAFACADLRIAPASPGKAERLLPLLQHPKAVLYVNLHEAGLLAHRSFDNAPEAAAGLVAQGARRVLVTDGARTAAEAEPGALRQAEPPPVLVTRITGAGDTFMAAHLFAERRGETREAALQAALAAAAAFVSGGQPS